MKTNRKALRAAVASATVTLTVLSLPAAGLAQQSQPTQIKPGFNLFSVEQDIEIGRQSAAEVERQLPVLSDRNSESYLNAVVRNLAAGASGAHYPYQARIVNASDINAFALPGGYLFVNRGLIEAVRSEGELAGVLAHEMSHIALRHGTHLASKAYAAQIGLGVLGGVLGGRGGTTNSSQIIQAIGGLGLNAVFLKFGRDDETQADVSGAQMMARAGYDPQEMVSFFELLQSQRNSNPGRVAQFFSDHPAPADRATRIRREAQLIGPIQRHTLGGLAQVQSQLRGYGSAPTTAEIARRQAPVRRTGGGGGNGSVYRGRVTIEPPSTRLRTFEQRDGFFQIGYPDNWQVYPSDNGFGATIAPRGGIVQGSQGEETVVYGVIINHYDPFESNGNGTGNATGTAGLSQATDDLLRQITRSNSYLRTTGGRRREQIDGQPALSVTLSGRSPATGDEERVTVFTRELPDGHVIYSLFIAPGADYGTLSQTFNQMMDTLQVDDRAAHR